MTDSRLRIHEEEGVTHVEFLDRNILDEANIEQIGREIEQCIDASPKPQLVIDFSNVEHLSSAALGKLITLNSRVRSRGGGLRLAQIDPQIYEVFTITKLDQLFEIHDTVDEAVRTFA